MARYDLEEQEQLEEIKAWWKLYGNFVTNTVIAVAVVVAGWQGWTYYQRRQAAQASDVYNALQQAAQAGDLARVKAASGELLEKFPGTSYAQLGALSAGKVLVANGDEKTAKLQLIWVAEHGENEYKDLGRLRAAALLMDEKQYAEAKKLLEGDSAEGFKARFAALRGDIFVAEGKIQEAATAYQQAMDFLTKGQGSENLSWQDQTNMMSKEVLQQKIDSLGESKA